jgi:CheY-like chemotaxis protein
MLEKSGHTVTIAENGKVVLRALEQQYFDLMLMDVQMTEMGGYEVTGLIREKEKRTGRHIPIVAMTAHAMAGEREQCLAAGMDNYISKPVSRSALLEMVEHYGGKPSPLPAAVP